MNHVFVVNAGSSSLKYQLINMDTEKCLVSGNCERIGIPGGFITYKHNGQKYRFELDMPVHKVGLDAVVKLLMEGDTKVIDSMDDIVAVGHRMAFSLSQSNEITDEVLADIESHVDMFPLHLPAMITGIKACRQTFAGKVQVAVYDNSFHLDMPQKAHVYAIPYEYYEKYEIRRYGYHGTSHRYVVNRLAKLLGKPVDQLKVVSCHLGNGSSIAAVDCGHSIDTTMGYTPLAGLMMGTRCGDIDPALISTIAQKENLTLEEVHSILNKKSGLLGISGVSSDARDVVEAMDAGNERAALACHMLRYQIKKYIGAYTAAMGGLDAVIFTGGMGENSPDLREEVCEGMGYFGIDLDLEKNKGLRGKETNLTMPGARTQVWLIPTNEELMIAQDAYNIYLQKQKG
ncbi:MAG: acetate kinase [Anaerotruncus sp.]|nr:acetate kinase [Anaerotruncus sp.]